MSQVDEPAGGGQATRATQYDEIYHSPEFAELRSRFRRLVFPLTGLFVGWYALYVAVATYAHDFMGEEVIGRINIGLIFGLLQFASTFGIAYFYSKRAQTELDGRSKALLARFDLGGSK